MTRSAEPLRGFTCKCGEFHTFGVYVAAHSTETLIHTCEKCGRQHEVKNYRVRLIKQRRRAKS